MAKKFTQSDIQQLKTEAWALKKSLQVKLAIAQDKVARENDYENWSLLMKHSNSPAAPITRRQVVFEALQDYVKALSKGEIVQLFLNGTIWVYLKDVANNEINQDSFQRLGMRQDGNTQQYSSGWGCIIDMDGMPDGYALKSELIDDDAIDENNLPVLTIEEARELILDMLDQEMDLHFDSVEVAADEAE